jgi:hypothetical protein
MDRGGGDGAFDTTGFVVGGVSAWDFSDGGWWGDPLVCAEEAWVDSVG